MIDSCWLSFLFIFKRPVCIFTLLCCLWGLCLIQSQTIDTARPVQPAFAGNDLSGSWADAEALPWAPPRLLQRGEGQGEMACRLALPACPHLPLAPKWSYSGRGGMARLHGRQDDIFHHHSPHHQSQPEPASALDRRLSQSCYLRSLF